MTWLCIFEYHQWHPIVIIRNKKVSSDCYEYKRMDRNMHSICRRCNSGPEFDSFGINLHVFHIENPCQQYQKTDTMPKLPANSYTSGRRAWSLILIKFMVLILYWSSVNYKLKYREYTLKMKYMHRIDVS